jgi:NADH:ubiquinone oxidoreductase subunit F (NADH-binding)
VTGGQSLPRLLAGIGDRAMTELETHSDQHGPLPDLHDRNPAELLEVVERAGLRGHGGASFPAAVKMRAVASRRKPKIVVANGSEGEPASKKDRALLREAPHLVLDGTAVAARAVGAREAIVAVSASDQRGIQSLQLALHERDAARLRGQPRIALAAVPERYLSGQETALVSLLNGESGRPTFAPPRPFERGVGGRPTLVQNVETLAHMALIARHGASWFRELGTDRDPGSALVTVSGAVARPGVYEIEHGMALPDLLRLAGANAIRAVLVGGYFGSWCSARLVPQLRLAGESLAEHGATLGAGVIVALGADVCPVAEATRVANYFSAQSAGQCGPCVHGLDAIAYTVHQLATGTAGRTAFAELERWSAELPRRGACQHPDGAVRFVSSALRVFADEFHSHGRHGPCERCRQRPVLATPAASPWDRG